MWITLKLQLKKCHSAARRRAQDEYLWEYQRRCQTLADTVRSTGKQRLSVGEARALLHEPLPTAAIIGVLRQVEEGAERVWPTLPRNDWKLEPSSDPDIYYFVLPTHERAEARLPVVIRQRERTMLKHARTLGAVQLVRSRRPTKGWALHLAVDVPERRVPPGDKVAGVDLGLKRLAVAWCDGEVLMFEEEARKLAEHRRQMAAARRDLKQQRREKVLRRMRDKEAQYVHDLLHQVSRRVVNWCKSKNVGTLVLEDLTGIRHKRPDRRDRGRSLHSWAYARLQKYVAYKARLAGMEVRLIDPAGTSRTCPECGYFDEGNRYAEQFRCLRCGFEDDADVVAARNLAARAAQK